MKALILVGGFGTRLRPMTLTKPKPLIDFANKPILCHQIEALSKAGVKEVILAINYQPEIMMKDLQQYEAEYGIKITCSIEEEPLGTAGPIKLAEKLLTEDNDTGMFFVFNADIICDYPLDQMVEFHKSHGKQGTIVVTEVEDPTRYGVIVAQENGEIERFVEKPPTFVSNKINAGLYLFNFDIIQRIPNKPTSIERVIFPEMAKDKELYQHKMPGYWMDIGQPKDYLIGQNMYIEAEMAKQSQIVQEGHNGNGVVVHSTATVHHTAQLGPNVVIGAGCQIGEGVKIRDSTILSNTRVLPYTLITGSIIGWKNTVGSWVRITNMTCTAEDVQIKDESCLDKVAVLPHKPITGVYSDTVIM